MSDLITIHDGTPTTTSTAIAEGTRTQHKNVLELVRKYQKDLEEFGRVAFQTRPFETAGGIQNQEIARLNERQATLVMTYMRNTAIVRSFKKRLVKEFYDMAEAIRLQSSRSYISSIIREEIQTAISTMFAATVDKLVDEKFKSDPRVAVVHGISARELLDREKVPSKGRRGLLLKTTNGLSNLCLEQGKKVERCARTKTKLYPTHVADAWLELHGRSLIKAHMEAVTSQCVLVFPKKGIECRTGEKEERS